MLTRPSGPCSLKRITQSRSVWRSMPAFVAASVRELPSSTAAIASNRRACVGVLRLLRQQANLRRRIVSSHRNSLAHGKRTPFATLNHSPADLQSPASQQFSELVLRINSALRFLSAAAWTYNREVSGFALRW